jgi:hypothetical protein
VVTLATIGAEARQLRFGSALLTAIAWVLIALGKAAYGVFALSWLAAAWTFCAIRQGWREGRAADQAKRLAARQAASR